MSATATPRNRAETGRFPPGVSGNPGGRPKGLARRVRELVGDDGQRLAEVFLAVLDDPASSVRERMEAATWLADRGWGRPTTVVSGEGDAPLQIVVRSMLAAAQIEVGAEPAELVEASG